MNHKQEAERILNQVAATINSGNAVGATNLYIRFATVHAILAMDETLEMISATADDRANEIIEELKKLRLKKLRLGQSYPEKISDETSS